MKVALYSPSWPPTLWPNGINTYVSLQAEALRRLGVEVVITTAHLPEPWTGRDTVHNLDGPRNALDRLIDSIGYRIDPDRAFARARGRAHARSLRALMRQESIDLYETEEAFGSLRWIAKALPIPTVVRLHGPYFLVSPAMGNLSDRAERCRIDAEGTGIVAADGVSAPSRFVLEQTREHYRMPLQNAVIIPNGIAIPDAQWHRQDADPQRILFVGRFDRLKGADTLLLAFDRLIQNGRALRLDFVGPHDKPMHLDGRSWTLREFLNARVSPTGQARITFTGFLPPEAVLPLRRRAALTIVPSRFETFSMTMIEAMAFGGPVVCARAAAMPEVLQDGYSGRLFAPGDDADLATTIEQMLDAPEHSAALGANARRICKTQYSAGEVARQTRDYYQDLIARANRVTPGVRAHSIRSKSI